MTKFKLSILGSLLMAMVLVNIYITYNKVQENNNLKVRLLDLTLRCDSLVKQLNVKLDIIEKADSIIIKKEPVIIKKDSTVIVKKTEVIKKTNDLYNIVYCDTTVLKQNDFGIFNNVVFKADGRYMVIDGFKENGDVVEMFGFTVTARKNKPLDYIDKMPVIILAGYRYKLQPGFDIKDIVVNESTESSIRYVSKVKLTFKYAKEAN